MRIHYRLSSLLTTYHLTAKEVAQATGVREATLSAMRRGTLRRLNDEVLGALVCYFRRHDPAFGPGDLYAGVECDPPAGEGRDDAAH